MDSMYAIKDMAGLKFGRLTVIKLDGRDKSQSAMWLCQCDCGQNTRVCGADLRRGNTRSCKHHNDSHTGKALTHGESVNKIRSPEFQSYCSAKARCTNPRKRNWRYYGGRGIEFRFSNFSEFLDEVGRRPSPQHSIDRIDNQGHYERGNVRWSTSSEQAFNRNPKGYLSHQGYLNHKNKKQRISVFDDGRELWADGTIT